MAFNGTGTFNRIYSWVTDAANSIFVSSSRMDTDTNDIAAGLSNCITKDGQTTVTANIPMSTFKFTGLGVGSAANDSASIANLSLITSTGPLATCEFRLTLTTAVPVTTADVTAATTVYCSPYKGNKIALYDGTNWNMRTSAEFSLALGTLTSGLPYDVFCYDNATVPTLEFLAWTNTTTRATALVLQNGVLSKTGALTRRYLGTFYTTSTTQTEDSFAKRFLWNYYNRACRPMRVLQAAGSYNYTTLTVRQANASAANQLDFVLGVSEDRVEAELHNFAAQTNVGITYAQGFGLDSTTTISTSSMGGVGQGENTANDGAQPLIATIKIFPGVGRHFLSLNEISTATGTTVWNLGNAIAGAGTCLNGIQGELWG